MQFQKVNNIKGQLPYDWLGSSWVYLIQRNLLYICTEKIKSLDRMDRTLIFPYDSAGAHQELHIKKNKTNTVFLEEFKQSLGWGRRGRGTLVIRMLIQLKCKPSKHKLGKEGKACLVRILHWYAYGEGSLFSFSLCLQLFSSVDPSALSPFWKGLCKRGSIKW